MIGNSDSEDVRLAHLRESLRTGLWFVPSLFVLGAIATAAVTLAIDRNSNAVPPWLAFNGGPTSAQQILVTVATSMMTFTGLVFSITVVALQLASSQFSPRILRTFLRDRGSQTALGVFISTFVYAIIVLGQVRTGTVGEVFVPELSVTVAILLVILSLATFVYYVNHITQSLRVVNIIEAVAEESRAVLRSFNRGLNDSPGRDEPSDMASLGVVTQTIAMDHRSGVLSNIDAAGLVDVGTRHNCVLRLLPDIGDYVAEGAPLFFAIGGDGSVSAAEVCRQLNFNRERTMRQDLAFGFRQLVDIAEKALSPALNDPTTAVQAVDRIHDLLRRLAGGPLPTGIYRDSSGDIRFVRKTMTWPGYVSLAYEEIRSYGASSVQVNRRLRASIDELLEMVTEDRRAPLERQLRLLDRSAERNFPDAEERLLVLGRDESGVGNDEDE